jgi:hypothetical protein
LIDLDAGLSDRLPAVVHVAARGQAYVAAANVRLPRTTILVRVGRVVGQLQAISAERPTRVEFVPGTNSFSYEFNLFFQKYINILYI